MKKIWGIEKQRERRRAGGGERRQRAAPSHLCALFLPLSLHSPPTLLSPIFSSSPIVFTSAVSCLSPPPLPLPDPHFLQRDSPSQAFPPLQGEGLGCRQSGGCIRRLWVCGLDSSIDRFYKWKTLH